MSDKNNVLTEITRLHGLGRVGDAHQLAQELARAMPGDADSLHILHLMRMEMFAKQQVDALGQLNMQLSRNTQSVAQLLVNDLLKDRKLDDPLRLERFGYSTASQNEEDGMLAEVFRRIGVTSKTFFEIGVGNGKQNNTFHFFLQNWKGWWIEINQPKVQFMRKYFSSALESGQLSINDTMINAENVNNVCRDMGIDEEVDLLSIDIDGNDYHVFNALTAVKARVVVLEYNPMYPPPMKIVGAYDPGYSYNENTYIGASLQSLTDLAEKKGYSLVACSIGGVNAIFVRTDLAKGKFSTPMTASHFYHSARYQLSFTGGFGAGGKANYGPLHDEDAD